MRRLLLDNGLFGPRKDWKSIEQVAVISASNDLREQRLLISVGFHKIDAPSPLSTGISLWTSPGQRGARCCLR